MGVENTSNKLVPVYDIVGCGPRKRFVANGKLIHNSEKINLENMPRGSVFRQALIPPPGYVIAACDSANIEARVLPWLAGQEDLLEQFRMQDTGEGLDVYSAMATRIYGRPVDRKRNPDDFIPGFLGKSVVLGCGFGLGWAKFQAMMRAGMLGQKGITFDQSFVDSMGVDLKKFMADKWCMRRAEEIFKPWDTMDTHIMHCSVAKAIIDTYRGSVPYVVELWGYLNDVILPAMANGDEIIFGPNDILRTGKDCLHTPSGFSLKYNGLHQREDEKGKRQWVYFGRNKKPVYTYGGALAENIVQHLARYIVTYQLILIGRRYKVATMTHDEVVALIPESEAEEGTAWMEDQMRKTKPWMAGIPINAEANWGQTYKDCK